MPLTLLEALAFDASGFDTQKKIEQPGAATKQGLFGFTDDQLEAYGVVDPFNPAHAIEGAALALVDILKHLSDINMALAAWYLGNVVKVAHLQGTTPRSWPTNVQRFCERLQKIRYWYQDRGMPRGATRQEHLQQAIAALADANPGLINPRINAARDAMHEYNTRILPDPLYDGLKIVWMKYRDAFDLAPITNDATPIPERISPDWWRQQITTFTPTVKKVAEGFEELAKATGEQIEKRINQIGVAAFVLIAGLGSLYIFANRKQKT
ncbi:MAG TPA: hypothetical protein VFN67_36415 [Polyangiales bacterium]|nr:hypothetical protein [Polyangiales bacterium]